MHKIRTPRPGGVPCPTARCTSLFSPKMANARHAIRLTSGCVGAALAGAEVSGAPQAGCRFVFTGLCIGVPGLDTVPDPAPGGSASVASNDRAYLATARLFAALNDRLPIASNALTCTSCVAPSRTNRISRSSKVSPNTSRAIRSLANASELRICNPQICTAELSSPSIARIRCGALASMSLRASSG